MRKNWKSLLKNHNFIPMKIAVVIPTYKEKENVQQMIGEILRLGIAELEIIIVDDNSPDGTAEVVRKIQETERGLHLIVRSGKLGYGTACTTGFKYALANGAEKIIGMDCDFSHDPKIIPLFLEEIKKYHVVMGSRYKNGISVVNWPLDKLILSLLAGVYVRLITGLKSSDPTSGFNCYRREVLEKVDLEKISSNGYAFLVEMKYRVQKAGFSAREIPVILVNRCSGASKMTKYNIWETFLIVWKLRLGLVK
jgi:dolichol-phosphate mannosyltransferase